MKSTVLRLFVMGIGVRKTRFFLRTIGFARTIALMTAMSSLYPERQTLDERWVPEIDRVSGSPYHANCLDRSVFLWFVLLQHGIEGDLRIGVARTGDGIDGHAWVERDGVVLNGSADVGDRFLVFEEDPVGMVFR